MTHKQLLVKELEEIAKMKNGDPEVAHSAADEALIQYINDAEVKAAYDRVDKWYA